MLKPTGSIYLHCDPSAGHYLKVVMDSIFGGANFRNEIIWKRTGAHSATKGYGPAHDTLLFYAKSSDFYWEPVRGPYDPQYVASKFTMRDTPACGSSHATARSVAVTRSSRITLLGKTLLRASVSSPDPADDIARRLAGSATPAPR